MTQRHISLFFISFLTFIAVHAQKEQDTAKVKQEYRLRFGVDISKPVISIVNNEDMSYEIVGDLRVYKKFYAAVELGFDQKMTEEIYFNFTTKGSYAKIGVNLNAYENWPGMRNEIVIGFRYGFSFFNQTLHNYYPNVFDDYFEPTVVEANTTFDDLSAQWMEFILGLKVETFKNLYLGASVSFKSMVSTKEPKNFKNLYVPGFYRVYSNDLGIGFNYTLSYSIPLLKI